MNDKIQRRASRSIFKSSCLDASHIVTDRTVSSHGVEQVVTGTFGSRLRRRLCRRSNWNRAVRLPRFFFFSAPYRCSITRLFPTPWNWTKGALDVHCFLRDSRGRGAAKVYLAKYVPRSEHELEGGRTRQPIAPFSSDLFASSKIVHAANPIGGPVEPSLFPVVGSDPF